MSSSPAPPRVMVPVTPAANWMTSPLPAKVIASRKVQLDAQTPIGPSEVLVTVQVVPAATPAGSVIASQTAIGRISWARNFPCLGIEFNQTALSATRTIQGGGKPNRRKTLVPSRSLEERLPPDTVVHVPVDGGVEAFLEIVQRFPL